MKNNLIKIDLSDLLIVIGFGLLIGGLLQIHWAMAIAAIGIILMRIGLATANKRKA